MRHETLGKLLVDRLRDSQLDLDTVADFLKVTVATVAEWNDDRLPRGETLNRLWHLLAFAGINSPEMNKIPEYFLYVGKLMAFRVVDLSEAQELCGGVKNPQAVLRAIRGESTVMRTKYETVEELQEQYDTKLASAIGTARDQYIFAVGEDVPATAAEPKSTLTESSFVTDAQIHDAARNLSAAIPTLRLLASERTTDAQRAFLRELMGSDGLFDLGNLVHMLSSRRAFHEGGR